jgi:phage gp36-like protein
MNYATQADLEELLPVQVLIGLTDDENLGVVHSGRVEAALETASITIDGYIGDRWPLPFAEAPPILTKICVDLAGHLLHLRRNQVSELWEKQSDNATRFLEKVSSGKLSLGAADPAGTGDKESLQVSAPDPLFDSETLDKY